MRKVVQTAGREKLGEFAPDFGRYNDDILFGEVWSNEALTLKEHSIVTIAAFMGRGLVDSSFRYHLETAKKNGVTREQIAAIITHAAFYIGWPMGWAAFNLAKEVWNEKEEEVDDLTRYANTIFFPVGEENVNYNKWFTGISYLAPVSRDQISISNITFEPGCRNFWHIHHAKSGGGQMLVCVGGRGWYQEEGKKAVELTPGTVIHIPAGVKHWHGAAADSWMSHLSVEVPGQETSNEWLEPVSDEEYGKLV